MNTLSHLTASPERASLITGALVLFSLVLIGFLIWIGQPELLNITYFGTSMLIAGWLYASNSPMYYGFVLWTWFLASFVRRVIDYQLGSFTPPGMSITLLTPFAVSSIAVLDIPRYGGLLLKRRFAPYLLCLCGIAYASILSFAWVSPMAATVALLNWIPPLLIGFHLLVNWRSYPRYRRVAQRTFTWCMLVIGLYGIAQFFLVPPWDAFWMIESEMNSIGHPYPMEIRIFGTLDSPGPFATVMLTGVILLFSRTTLFSLLSAVPGYVSFLLCMVRGAWLGWVIALGTLIVRLKGTARLRLVAFAGGVALLAVPLILTLGPIGEVTGSRMSTLTDVQSDGSFQERMNLYTETLWVALTSPMGHGLGSRGIDSGVVEMLWEFGWLGTTLYVFGLYLILRNAMKSTDTFAIAALAVVLSLLFQLLAANQFAQVTGVILWSMLSLAAASHFYEDAASETNGAQEKTDTPSPMPIPAQPTPARP